MAFIQAIAVVTRAIHALVRFLSKTAARQRQKIARRTEAQALGFRKLRKAINARKIVRQSINASDHTDIMPDDPFKRKG